MYRTFPTFTLVVAAGYAALQPHAGATSAVSQEALTVRKAARQLTMSEERSQTLFGSKAAAISEVQQLADACAQDGWDGQGASGINAFALARTIQFIRALPVGVTTPEFSPEPDGSISLDWINSRYRMISLSIGLSSRLSYAWLDGVDRGHGVAQFEGLKLPPLVLNLIRSIVKHDDAAIGFA